MTTYNRQWLRDQIVSYLHDDSVGVAELDTWIDIGAQQISEGMQCYEMERTIDRGMLSGNNYIDLAPGVKEVLGVQWLGGVGAYSNLRVVDQYAAVEFKRAGVPAVYYIEDRKVYPAPWLDADYRVMVIDTIVIPDDPSAELPVLTAYPAVFLSAAMQEAYDWKQNDAMAVRYEQKWRDRANSITIGYLKSRVGDSPAMRAR